MDILKESGIGKIIKHITTSPPTSGEFMYLSLSVSMVSYGFCNIEIITTGIEFFWRKKKEKENYTMIVCCFPRKKRNFPNHAQIVSPIVVHAHKMRWAQKGSKVVSIQLSLLCLPEKVQTPPTLAGRIQTTQKREL